MLTRSYAGTMPDRPFSEIVGGRVPLVFMSLVLSAITVTFSELATCLSQTMTEK